jgi:hypothetical protein
MIRRKNNNYCSRRSVVVITRTARYNKKSSEFRSNPNQSECVNASSRFEQKLTNQKTPKDKKNVKTTHLKKKQQAAGS